MLDLVHILDLNGGTLDSSKACAFEGQSAKCSSKALGRVCECQQTQNTKETVLPSNHCCNGGMSTPLHKPALVCDVCEQTIDILGSPPKLNPLKRVQKYSTCV